MSRNPTVFLGRKKRIEFIKTEKEGLPKELHKLL